MKEKIFVFDVFFKKTGERCFSVEVIGKTRQGARVLLNKAIKKKIIALAEITGGLIPTFICRDYKAEYIKEIDF